MSPNQVQKSLISIQMTPYMHALDEMKVFPVVLLLFRIIAICNIIRPSRFMTYLSIRVQTIDTIDNGKYTNVNGRRYRIL